MKAMVRSKIPLTRKKKPTSAASVVNAACGWMIAQMPAPMKRTPTIACTILQPRVETAIWPNSFAPAKIAATPNRMETA